MDSFRTFLEDANVGAYTNTAFAGFDNQWFGVGHSPELPTPTLEIPTKTFQTEITQIFYTQNPICICLANKMMWKLTKEQWEYAKSIGREPKIHSRVQIETLLDGTVQSISLI